MPKYIGQILHIYLKGREVEKESSVGRTTSWSIVRGRPSENICWKRKDPKYLMIWDSNTDEISVDVTIVENNTLQS